MSAQGKHQKRAAAAGVTYAFLTTLLFIRFPKGGGGGGGGGNGGCNVPVTGSGTVSNYLQQPPAGNNSLFTLRVCLDSVSPAGINLLAVGVLTTPWGLQVQIPFGVNVAAGQCVEILDAWVPTMLPNGTYSASFYLAATCNLGDPSTYKRISPVYNAGEFTITGDGTFQPLAAHVVADPTSTMLGNPISFTGSATGGVLAEPIQFAWDLGDGTKIGPGNTSSTTHVYANPGTYTVKLTVYDYFGESASTTTTVTVT